MFEAPKKTLPSHLIDLLDPTPHGNAKLLAAWDGLTLESHMQVLMELKTVTYPEHLAKRVMVKALESPNAYIRYIAANEILRNLGDDDEEGTILKKQIETDSYPLVKYCQTDRVTHNPPAFFALPHEARLAQVRHLGIGSAEKIMASLITYALKNLIEKGEVSEIELEEILTDYICRPVFKERCQKDRLHYDGFLAHRTEEDLASLWELVPKVPEKISYALLQHLPPLPNSYQDIPESVLDELTSNQLFILLERPDIELIEFRKRLFNRQNDIEDLVRSMAVAHHFHLQDNEFSDILKKPKKEKSSILLDMAISARDLRLVIYQALHDILEKGDTMYWEMGEPAKMNFERKAKELEGLEGWEKKAKMIELKLYTLAEKAVPWDKSEEGYLPEKPLEFLGPLTVKGDTWQTFRNYKNEWGRHSEEKLYKYLPFISEIEKKEEYTKEFKSKISIDLPLSRKEFYNFYIKRQEVWLLPIIMGGFGLALAFGAFAVWAMLTGDQEENLWNYTGIAVGSLLFTILIGKALDETSKELKAKAEKEDL